MTNRNQEVSFEIKQHIGVIETGRTDGWNKELNIVAWNGNPPKFDIRDWDESHKRMSRGITLFDEAARRLYEVLKEYYEEV